MPLKNSYFLVKEPFTVQVRRGHVPANVFIGRLRACQTVYEAVTVQPGDEIHDLCGGKFLVPKGSNEGLEFDMRIHEAHEVLLHPAPPEPPLPLAKLAEFQGGKPRDGYKRSI